MEMISTPYSGLLLSKATQCELLVSVIEDKPYSTEDPGAFAKERERMVEDQLVVRGIKDKKVLDAMRIVPRHCFVPARVVKRAYMDGPLQIGESQTISQPYIVALMTEMLKLTGHETVLEVGTGSGYQAAVLGFLAKEVHTIERHDSLAKQAQTVLDELCYRNVNVHQGDGSLGLPDFAPYGGIMVTAAAPEAPQPLLEQLAEGAYLVVPVGGYGGQYLQQWQRKGSEFTHDDVLPVSFVPMRGQYGWKKQEWSF
jgi:protein-L-isoaspartate(D-aspartate) O-methyltransferase